MKTELRLKPHTYTSGVVCEVWAGGQLIATVYGSDVPGVRVISKFPMTAEVHQEDGTVGITEVKVQTNGR